MIELLFAFLIGLEKPKSVPIHVEPAQVIGFTELDFGIEAFKYLEIGSKTKIYIFPHNQFFAPLYADFFFYTELSYSIFSIGYEHLCSHNFDGHYWMLHENMGYDRIYLRIGNGKN
jgi:hypothetical protein